MPQTRKEKTKCLRDLGGRGGKQAAVGVTRGGDRGSVWGEEVRGVRVDVS